MPSNINVTAPATGAQVTSEGLREVFSTIKGEIEALQSSDLSTAESIGTIIEDLNTLEDTVTGALEDIGNVSGVAGTALQPNTPVHLGSLNNYVSVDEHGTLRLGGDGTYFEDLIGDIGSTVTSGPGVSLNDAEQTIDFVATANLSDYAWNSYQLKHAWKAGSIIRPHIHWEQTLSGVPNWLMKYRWQIQGGAKTTAWTNYKCNSIAFPYVSGTLNQISYGTGIVAPVNFSISDIIQIQLYRDTTNASTLFTAVDPNNATARIASFDVHIECDALGSNTEYTKE